MTPSRDGDTPDCKSALSYLFFASKEKDSGAKKMKERFLPLAKKSTNPVIRSFFNLDPCIAREKQGQAKKIDEGKISEDIEKHFQAYLKNMKVEPSQIT